MEKKSKNSYFIKKRNCEKCGRAFYADDIWYSTLCQECEYSYNII